MFIVQLIEATYNFLWGDLFQIPQPAGAHRHFERATLREADCVPRPGFHLRHLRPGAAFAPRPARRRRPRAGDFAR